VTYLWFLFAFVWTFNCVLGSVMICDSVILIFASVVMLLMLLIIIIIIVIIIVNCITVVSMLAESYILICASPGGAAEHAAARKSAKHSSLLSQWLENAHYWLWRPRSINTSGISFLSELGRRVLRCCWLGLLTCKTHYRVGEPTAA